jgi:hypothetical protein
MAPEAVKEKLIAVLQMIQGATDVKGESITGHTRPLTDMHGFDSKVWPAAISMLAAELGVPIPNDVNIFRVPRGTRSLTIDETVALVCRIVTRRETSSAGRDSSGSLLAPDATPARGPTT